MSSALEGYQRNAEGITKSSALEGYQPNAEVYNEFGLTVESKLRDYTETWKVYTKAVKEAENGNKVITEHVTELPIKIYGEKGTIFENFLFEYHATQKVHDIFQEDKGAETELSYYIIEYSTGKIYTELDYVRVPVLKYREHFEFFRITEAIRNVFIEEKKIRIQYFVSGGYCLEREYTLEAELENKSVWEVALSKECDHYGRILHQHLKDEREPLRQEGCTPGDNPGVYYFTLCHAENFFEKQYHHQPADTRYNGLSYDYGTCNAEFRRRGVPVFCIAVHYEKVLIDYAVVKSKDEITSGTYKRKGYDYKDAIFLQGMKHIADGEFELEIIYLLDDCSCQKRIYTIFQRRMNSYDSQPETCILHVGYVTTKDVDCPTEQKVLWIDVEIE